MWFARFSDSVGSCHSVQKNGARMTNSWKTKFNTTNKNKLLQYPKELSLKFRQTRGMSKSTCYHMKVICYVVYCSFIPDLHGCASQKQWYIVNYCKQLIQTNICHTKAPSHLISFANIVVFFMTQANPIHFCYLC